MRRLGGTPGPSDDIGVLARVEVGGTVTVLVSGVATELGIGGWQAAGPGRVVLVAEWLVRGVGRRAAVLSVRAAAELSPDGRTCQARLQWRHLDLTGAPQGVAVTAEADGTRLQP